MSALAWPYPRFVAHRGGGSLAPENTLAAFRTGLAYGYKAAECDVKLSADGVCFLLHDDEVNRTSNGQGSADQLSMAALSMLDAGSWHSQQFAGECLPTLPNIAAFCQAHQLNINIEIKPSPEREEETGTQVARTAAQLWQHHSTPPLLSSFSFESLAAAAQSAPQLPRAMLWEHIPADWLAQLQAINCVALHCDHVYLTADLTKAIKAAGYPIMCYTVNTVERAQELFAWGVDSICTDRLDLLDPNH